MENTIELDKEVALVKKSLKKAISYNEYRALVTTHVQNGTNTGPNQTNDLAQYTLLNDSRMRRLDKTIKIPNQILEQFANYGGSQTWLVITESWCGDAAQSMPIMNTLSEVTQGVCLKIVLRDEHPELMDAFLTNGSKSIPKLIVFDTQANEIKGDWGPRPTIATELVNDYKAKNGTLTPQFKEELQVWYNKDKGINIIEDLAELID